MMLGSKEGDIHSDNDGIQTAASSSTSGSRLVHQILYDNQSDEDDSDSDGIEGCTGTSKDMGKLLHHQKAKRPVNTEKSDDDDNEEVDEEDIDFGVDSLPRIMAEAGNLSKQVCKAGWKVVRHCDLPQWLRDNDFIHNSHRPELRSFLECFKSIFRIHTETGNIWTHLLGFTGFIGMTTYFISRPSLEIQWQEKLVFSAFFFGAILCLGFSWVFHTVNCHSERVGKKLFNKLDYCGICFLIIGSFVPWLYYNFYCSLLPRVIYLCSIFSLGMGCLVVSLLEWFTRPKFRPFRAGMFIALGLSAVIPAIHFVVMNGFWNAVDKAALGWFILMAFLYIFGAIIYAVRIPERIFPGKCDIVFQSHQLFHLFVIAGALVHYHGITEIANYRLSLGDCFESIAV